MRMGRILGAGLLILGLVPAQELPSGNQADCSHFQPEERERTRLSRYGGASGRLSADTMRVVSRLGRSGEWTRDVARSSRGSSTNNFIDRNIFGVLRGRGIEPAQLTSDAEFLRRVTLDLTGRVPTAEQLQSFLADADPGKRARYIDELLESPERVDKWTMFFGDLFRNTEVVRASGTNRYSDGREAFYDWIKESVASNKPYNEVARQLIAAEGQNSFERGELNWLVGSRVVNGPVQDMYDQMAADTAKTFLGLGHLNCVLCHNGRGHLTTLSLWGGSAARTQAYGFAAFFSRTGITQTRPVAGNNNYNYWNLTYNSRGSYQMNTTTGNRPPRQAIGEMRVAEPVYSLGGAELTPSAGENWRGAAARFVTADPLFATAAVNYLWKAMMVRGLVEPVDQIDPARLDPDNPPPAPWTLQPSNARLLKELSAHFVESGYDIKGLLRLIANSETYQLSSRYDGEWKPEYETLHARKLVRRLLPEEIYDAVQQTSGLKTLITIPVNANDRNLTRTVFWAMQIPSPGSRGGAAGFLNLFYPGDREDNARMEEGSDQQALALMNNNFVLSRTRAVGSSLSSSLLRVALQMPDAEMVDHLFLTVLSRKPDDAERTSALELLRRGARQQQGENLLWALYNKVDFIFNY